MSPDAMLLTLAMRALAWTSDTDALAAAIMAEAHTWDEATLAAAVVFREASNRLNIVGDRGRALCAKGAQRAGRAVVRASGKVASTGPHSYPVGAGRCVFCTYEAEGEVGIPFAAPAVERVDTRKGPRDLCERHASIDRTHGRSRYPWERRP